MDIRIAWCPPDENEEGDSSKKTAQQHFGERVRLNSPSSDAASP
jgi:hypothetical protein